MKDLLKKITGHIIIGAIISIILGLTLFIWPNEISKAIIYLLAAGVAIMGIVNIVSYIRTKESVGSIVVGVIELILALILFIFTAQVGSLIGIILGIIIVITGVLNIVSSIDLKRMQVGSWIWILLLNIIVVIAGVVVIIDPFPSVLIFAQALGIILICKGIIDVISGVSFSKSLKNS